VRCVLLIGCNDLSHSRLWHYTRTLWSGFCGQELAQKRSCAEQGQHCYAQAFPLLQHPPQRRLTASRSGVIRRVQATGSSSTVPTNRHLCLLAHQSTLSKYDPVVHQARLISMTHTRSVWTGRVDSPVTGPGC
jgi:hypothetical protein